MFGFPYLSLKLSLTLPNKEKMLWCSYFRSFIKSINLDRCGNFIEKFNFVSTPSKSIIPIAHHPPYHPLNTPLPMPPPTLPPPPTTSLTSTPHTPLPTHGEKVGSECLIFHGLLHIVYPFGRQKYHWFINAEREILEMATLKILSPSVNHSVTITILGNYTYLIIFLLNAND